jgi:hypothetical protein
VWQFLPNLQLRVLSKVDNLQTIELVLAYS